MKYILPCWVLICMSIYGHAQTDSSGQVLQTVNRLSDKTLNALNNRYSLLDKLVERQTEKMLQRMQKKETALQQQLQGKDSLKAQQLFSQTQQKYQQLLAQLQSPPTQNIANPLKEYIPLVDSMQTAMRFLSQAQNATIPGIPADKLQQIQAISQQLQLLQARLQSAGSIQQYIAQREQLLQSSLSGLGLDRSLQGLNKEAYYYQQQLVEYKSMLHDPKKAEEKALAILSQQPAFQNFMAQHSYLSQLFHIPADYGTPASLDGLQTKAMIGKLIGQHTGTAGGNGSSGNATNPQEIMQGAVQAAQAKLSQLQSQISQLGIGGGSSNSTVMPDFSPNGQKTKTFWKRLELGYNLQTQKSNVLLPTATAFGLSLGYKIDDKKIVGVGASYNVGWGNGINHFAISSQGVGLRGFADLKLKGSFWIAGGFEYNYLQQLESVRQLYDWDVWQKSALLGLTKKYQVTKNKGGNLQLLYDFLYKDHIPESPPILFRMGFSL